MESRVVAPRFRSVTVLNHADDPFDALAATWWDDSGILRSIGVLLDPVHRPFVLAAIDTELGNGPHRVLDVGAGGGRLGAALAGEPLEFVALDPSLDSLRSGAAHMASPDRAFVRAAGEQLPFTDGSFDVVVCLEVLEHVSAPSRVVAEASRVLRPGGVFVFSGPNRTAASGLGLVLVAQHLFGLIPRGTHEWHRLLRPGDMNRLMGAADIVPRRTTGVGLPLRAVPSATVAIAGLLTRRLTHPEAAQRIRLATGLRPTMAYVGYGVRC